MLATLAPYLVALSAMSFAALSALTLISWINRFDPPADTSRSTADRLAA